MSHWYQLDTTEVLQRLGTDATQGLSEVETSRRLAEYGPNELIERGVKSPWAILWEQLTGVMVVILIVAAVVSAALGDYKDALAIAAIVILNTVLGFTQEYRAEKAMAALKKLAVPNVRVRRDGHVKEISSRLLAPGDIVLLEAGNLVPADGRLIESANLRVQEAALTGESEAVEKDVHTLHTENLPLGDRRNMAFKGTVVTYGRGAAVVTETGMRTQLGRIAEMIQTVQREPTPLQRRLAQLGRGLGVAALAIVAVVFALGVLRGEEVKLMFLTAMSMAVAAVPEGLPAVVTIALALGAQRMLKRRTLIRKLPAVETLGSVTVICSDKTGTLTQNRMTVTMLDVAGSEQGQWSMVNGQWVNATRNPQPSALTLLLIGGALCNDALLEMEGAEIDDFVAVGDPTEGALVVAAARQRLWKAELEQAFPRVAEAPFDSVRKRMTTVHKAHGCMDVWTCGRVDAANSSTRPYVHTPFVAFTKGAVDSLLEVCTQVWVNEQAEPLTDEWRERINVAHNQLAESGTRVLGVAFRPLDAPPANGRSHAVERDLIFIGLVGMMDPPRPEVKDAVATCKAAGIRPIMITGDHPVTAQHIARDLGIVTDGRVLTGQDLNRLSVTELEDIVGEVSVYARVSPEHKLKIVEALQERGHIVAMTGDGVNDAPALRKADIGVAMGVTGTDVSKEVADMVLLDDNFATIVAAVEEGRVIYDNIRKFIKYLMTTNSGELWLMLLAPFLGMPLPLMPLQILWINLMTDGLPALALGMEPAERDAMRRPPYHPNENIFGRGMGWHILWVGLVMGAVSLGVGYGLWSAGDPHWQTMVFTVLAFSQLCHALAIRSESDSLFRIGLLSNKPFLGAVVLTFVLQLMVVYVPFAQGVFKTTSLPAANMAICLGLSTVVFWAVEIEKWLRRRRGAAQS